MSVTYKKLSHLLIERKMKKKDLKEQAGLTQHEMLKLRHDMNITTETIGKICVIGSKINEEKIKELFRV